MMQKTLIAIFIFIILAAGVALFGWPKYQEVQLASSEVKIKKLEAQDKEKYFSDLNSISNKLDGYSLELAKIDAALPSEPDIPALFNFLQKESSQSGLILKNLTWGGVASFEQSAGIQKITFSLSLAGSYSSFKNFLANLRNNARLFEVESISLTPPAKGDVFSFDLKIRTHSY